MGKFFARDNWMLVIGIVAIVHIYFIVCYVFFGT